MILLKVDPEGLGLLPLECDAPRSVDVDRIALRLSMKSVKIEARLPQTIERASRIESVEPYQRATVQIAAYPG